MSIITGSHGSSRRSTLWVVPATVPDPFLNHARNIRIAVAVLGLFLCLDRVAATEDGPDKRPTLQVPLTDSKPVVDGKLEEPC